MAQCIADYRAGSYSTPLFTRDDDGDLAPDLLESPRLAWVPQLHALEWGAADDVPQRYRIKAFLPLFLQTLYFSCSNSSGVAGAGCDGYFDPARATSTSIPPQGPTRPRRSPRTRRSRR